MSLNSSLNACRSQTEDKTSVCMSVDTWAILSYFMMLMPNLHQRETSQISQKEAHFSFTFQTRAQISLTENTICGVIIVISLEVLVRCGDTALSRCSSVRGQYLWSSPVGPTGPRKGELARPLISSYTCAWHRRGFQSHLAAGESPERASDEVHCSRSNRLVERCTQSQFV